MISSLNFTQQTPLLTWTINHNFGAAPVCDVVTTVNGVVTKVFPRAVRHVSETQLLIDFTEPTTGTARLVGKYSFAAQAGAGSVDLGQSGPPQPPPSP